ncbi:sigma-70 family RNA polymerase sigma factor [Streptomyces anulatus]|uniref:sigma-70 family RNA polymerase sigma factor n=1 Tax=Streptomyces anulatus TaxID=1892 RepID=UPI001D182004|nr:sigma-70 family RNA polymerase sigma factor [Streptomyces anulatus]
MDQDDSEISSLVRSAQAGDQYALEGLIATYLPLIYNIVGRSMNGHPDVDDVVQETMYRALQNLGGLREPSRFRSWLVAIAMNQVRQRWTERQKTATPIEYLAEVPDPMGDFVNLTILQLGLTGQRQEVAEATRWLDDDDRYLLALWWQEVGGRLTRAEIATVLDVTPQHAAVRIQRMKSSLDTGRVVVRALSIEPRCSELSSLLSVWDDRPAPVWRKRIVRHARACSACSGHWSNLVPAEGLLVGVALVAPLFGYNVSSWLPDLVAMAANTSSASGSAVAAQFSVAADVHHPLDSAEVPFSAAISHPADQSSAAPRGRLRKRAIAGGTVVIACVLLVLLWPSSTPTAPKPSSAPSHHHTQPQHAASSSPSADIEPSRTSVPTPPPSRSALPTPTTPTRSPSLSHTPEQQLTRLINARRLEAGCAALRTDPRLSTSARDHAQDMVKRSYFDHVDTEGHNPDHRMRSAGYPVGLWAENLDRGTANPETVVNDWMDGSIHQQNMLDCRYKDTGVAAVAGPNGMIWVQTLSSPLTSADWQG